MMRRYLLLNPILNPFLIGGLFGAVQTGYFLQLSFAFSSAAITLFSVTLAWLLGVAGGLWLTRRFAVLWWQMSILSVGSYLLCCALLAVLPLQGGMLPIYLCLVIGSGLYAGWFFATAAARFRGRAERLFFWENNGFVLGIALTTVVYMLEGRPALWTLPVILGVLSYPGHQKEDCYP